MTIQLNGKAEQIAQSTTIAALLAQKNIKAGAVVVEVNVEIVPKDAYATRVLAAGDSVEILHFVGGG
jgi:thiamine biosynthesis protein ThiS